MDREFDRLGYASPWVSMHTSMQTDFNYLEEWQQRMALAAFSHADSIHFRPAMSEVWAMATVNLSPIFNTPGEGPELYATQLRWNEAIENYALFVARNALPRDEYLSRVKGANRFWPLSPNAVFDSQLNERFVYVEGELICKLEGIKLNTKAQEDFRIASSTPLIWDED